MPISLPSIIRSRMYSAAESTSIMGAMCLDNELSTPLIRAFASVNADLNALTDDGETLYHHAVRQKKLKMIKTLQECGGDLHTLNESGLKALHYAGMVDDYKFIDYFMNEGFDINDQGQSTKTTLMFAAFADKPKIVSYVLGLGGNPYIKDIDSNSWSSLHIAIEGQSHDALMVMLDNGIDPNIPSDDNITPLHWAAFRDDAASIRLLLKHGADKHAYTMTGETAWDLASPNTKKSMPQLKAS